MTRSQIIVFLLLAAFAHPSFSKTNVFLSSYFSADSVQVPPPPVQADTTSGWKIVFTYPAPSDYSIAALQFPSRDTGYAAVYNGTHIVLLRSTDQGFTWDTMPTFIPSGPLTFVTAKIGFCGGGATNKVVWKTTDGGNTWTPYPENSIATGPIVFGNADTGVVLGSTEIARTTDGGLTWYQAYPSGMSENGGATAPDGKTFFGVGLLGHFPAHLDWPQAGYFQKSTDGGATWTQYYSTIPVDLWGCYAIDQNHVLIGGSQGYIGRSSDGGQTWDTTKISVYSSEIDYFSFTDSLHGIAAGALSTLTELLAVTTDGGITWSKIYPPNYGPIDGVSMLSDSVAIICSQGNIMRTTSLSFPSTVVQPQNPNFQIQVFPNPTAGVTTIQYQLPTPTTVSFRFFDVLGNTIRTIPPQPEPQGLNQITFDGSMLAAGVYYFTLTTGQGSYTGQITVQK